MSIEWYNAIAKRNGGYKSEAIFTKVGLSGEDAFEKLLIRMLPDFDNILDIGCGHGEFTLRMAEYAKKIIGADNSVELLRIAKSLKNQSAYDNIDFIYASTKEVLPFNDGQFDLIYSRRGPTSILKHSRILRPGGTIFGIHTRDLDLEHFKRLMFDNNFIDFRVEVFDKAIMYFPDKVEFGKYLASCHGNPDYTLPEYSEELDRIIEANMLNERIAWNEHRYIWRAKKL